MRWFGALAMAALLCACAVHKNSAQEPSDPASLEELTAKAQAYAGWLKAAALPQEGWASTSCDALKYSGLWAASLADPTFMQAEKAEVAPGKWFRRSLTAGLCYPDHSDSTISKDMMMGLAWWVWRAKRLDVMQQLIDYGDAHTWVLGDPIDRPDKVVATPSMVGLFYQVLYKLGGPDHPSRHLEDTEPYPSGLTGYEAELQVWGILLHGEVDDTPGISDAALARLHEHAAAQPRNPFFATALAHYTGDTAAARALLGDEQQWPSDHLPTPAANHCSAWAIQRDDGADWQPCPGGGDTDVLYGADFQAVVGILTGVRF